MMHMLKVFIAAIVITISTPAFADRIENPNQLADTFNKCAANYEAFGTEINKMNQRIQTNSQEYNLNGTITYQSTMVWNRDMRMLMHYFQNDWHSVVHDTGATVQKCNAVINYYSRCMEELWDNVVAKVSVRRPTTGCLGRLYDTYGDMHPDSYQHGR